MAPTIVSPGLARRASRSPSPRGRRERYDRTKRYTAGGREIRVTFDSEVERERGRSHERGRDEVRRGRAVPVPPTPDPPPAVPGYVYSHATRIFTPPESSSGSQSRYPDPLLPAFQPQSTSTAQPIIIERSPTSRKHKRRPSDVIITDERITRDTIEVTPTRTHFTRSRHSPSSPPLSPLRAAAAALGTDSEYFKRQPVRQQTREHELRRTRGTDSLRRQAERMEAEKEELRQAQLEIERAQARARARDEQRRLDEAAARAAKKEQVERDRALAETLAQMELERQAAERREREESLERHQAELLEFERERERSKERAQRLDDELSRARARAREEEIRVAREQVKYWEDRRRREEIRRGKERARDRDNERLEMELERRRFSDRLEKRPVDIYQAAKEETLREKGERILKEERERARKGHERNDSGVDVRAYSDGELRPGGIRRRGTISGSGGYGERERWWGDRWL